MLPISIYKPSIIANGSNVTYTPEGELLADTRMEGAFNFVLQANGGYWSLSLTMPEHQLDAENWIESGIGHHVVVRDEALVVIWEGFINQVSASLGGLAVTRGPLMDIATRASVVYSPLDDGLDVPAAGATTTTTVADNDASKLKYGVFEKVLSGSRVSDDNADYGRDSYLAENHRPQTSKQWSAGGAEPSVTIECLGYIHFLKNYIYNQTATIGSVRISDITGSPKLHAVLDADPNGLFSSANANLAQNYTLVAAVENQNNTAWSVVMGMVALGDASGNRFLLSVGKDRYIMYQQMPSDLEYEQRLSDPAQIITTAGGQVVEPWNVEAGKWLLFTDFLIGKTIPSDLRDDPRALFIESNTYSAPYGTQLVGAKVSTAKQILARLGIGGIS